MKEQKTLNISEDKVIQELEVWRKEPYNYWKDYDSLWEMFKAVIATSGYGTSEYGGPVWIMDFSLQNLMKLFPDNPWLLAMEKEWDKGKLKYTGCPVSGELTNFSAWFSWRANSLITRLGLGNVIVKLEAGSPDGNVRLYGWGIFLDVVQSLVMGEVNRPCKAVMMDSNYSLRECEIVRQGKFLTYLKSAEMLRTFPCSFGSGYHYFRHSNTYGDCYKLEHFSLTKGFVIPESIPEKFLMLIVNDLMEAKAHGYGNKTDEEGNTCPYPQMKFENYLDSGFGLGNHFQPTTDVYCHRRSDGKIEEIKVDLPQIAPEHKEFWHRQFPPKQNWRKLEED